MANAGADDAHGLVALAEPVVVVLAAAAKLFKESNANVLAALFDVVRALAELELGPSSRNISGARRAADRLVRAARAQRTAPARRAS